MPVLCDEEFLTVDEAAELLRVKRRTLDNLRWKKTGPPCRRHGGRIVYPRKGVLEWSERHAVGTAPGYRKKKAPHQASVSIRGAGPDRADAAEAERARSPSQRKR